MFNKVKGSIKMFKEVFKASARISSLTMSDYEKIASPESVKELNGIHYVPFNDLLKANGFMFACVVDGGVILTDDLFEKLSDNTKYFLLLHELGHKENNHLQYIKENYRNSFEVNKERNKLTKHKKVMPIELEADSYALNYMSVDNIVDALKEVNKVTYEEYYMKNKEVDLRIKYMKETKNS